jgi:hypothetical protein
MPSNYEAVRRYRQRLLDKASSYDVMLEVLRIYLEALSQRAPTANDVLELLEKLCVVGSVEDCLDKVHMLKSKYQKSPRREPGVKGNRHEKYITETR